MEMPSLCCVLCPVKPAHAAAGTFLLNYVSLLEMASPLYYRLSTMHAAGLPAMSQLAFLSTLYCNLRLFCLK